MWGVKVEIVCERHKVRGTGAKKQIEPKINKKLNVKNKLEKQ